MILSPCRGCCMLCVMSGGDVLCSSTACKCCPLVQVLSVRNAFTGSSHVMLLPRFLILCSVCTMYIVHACPRVCSRSRNPLSFFDFFSSCYCKFLEREEKAEKVDEVKIYYQKNRRSVANIFIQYCPLIQTDKTN